MAIMEHDKLERQAADAVSSERDQLLAALLGHKYALLAARIDLNSPGNADVPSAEAMEAASVSTVRGFAPRAPLVEESANPDNGEMDRRVDLRQSKLEFDVRNAGKAVTDITTAMDNKLKFIMPRIEDRGIFLNDLTLEVNKEALDRLVHESGIDLLPAIWTERHIAEQTLAIVNVKPAKQ